MYLGVLIESKFLHRQAAEIGLYKTGKNSVKTGIETLCCSPINFHVSCFDFAIHRKPVQEIQRLEIELFIRITRVTLYWPVKTLTAYTHKCKALYDHLRLQTKASVCAKTKTFR